MNVHIIVSVLFLAFAIANGFFFSYEDLGIGVLKKYALRIIEKSGGKTQCAHQLRAFVNDLIDKRTWALEMFDASAKPQTGILNGNIMQMGNFDQCLAIKGFSNETTIKGKYCTINVTPGENNTDSEMALNADKMIEKFHKKYHMPRLQSRLKLLNLTWGICIPAACTTKRLQKIWNHTERYYKTGVHLSFEENLCATIDKPVKQTSGEIFAHAFLAGMVLVMVLSTIYDLRMRGTPKDLKSELLTAFSIYSNGAKMFSLNTSDNINLHCINGLRVLSMAWIIFSHRFAANAFLPTTNAVEVLTWRNSPITLLIFGTPSAVDTFLVISGILVVYLYLSMTETVKFNLMAYYVHRFMRLTPALFGLLLMYTYVAKHIGSGPIWSGFDLVQRVCDGIWLNTLSYTQNYYRREESCIAHSWYLSVDTQLYFMAPLFLPMLLRYPKRTVSILFALTAASCSLAFWLTWKNEYGAIFIHASKEYYFNMYFPTHLRMTPWLIGAVFGYFIYKTKKTGITINKTLVVLFWSLSLYLMYYIIYIQADFVRNEYNKLNSSLFNGFARPLWGLCVCWIIFACTNGYGGVINRFLSLPIFVVLARLNYCMALLHVPIIGLVGMQARYPRHFSILNGFHDFCGDFMMTLLGSIVWSLAFESPVLVLERILLKRGEKVVADKKNN